MGLIVLPATISDIASAYDVYFAAFNGDLIFNILYPRGMDTELRKEHTANTLQWWHGVTVQHTFKCVDTDTGKVVGMAVWDVYWRARTDEERKRPTTAWLEGAEKERAEAFLESMWKMREKLLGGRRHVYCSFLAVHPDHQRRGIGKPLMDWGLDVGEKLRLPVYLESTLAGLPLYTKLGFEKLSQGAPLKAEVTRLASDVKAPLMVKMPSAARGLRFEEWVERGYPSLG
ncbi:hypothetical protein AJ78_08722 [Emergomyces pasteurianus Ep9510]|uniref:N-acetyltransferase domain-containing protein n=1 Tax=Emergomyces pasteurianus Ep9510 TaxID=1447872 RepID=A0A1J9P2S4_9EURO|nr:hypothetical protein AJ78_08722 [Emergomyces pasteurianus Ep9510]